MVLCWSLDKTGPICRSAEDAAIVYYYIKGTDGKDGTAIDHAFNYTGKVDLKKIADCICQQIILNLCSKDAPEWKVIEAIQIIRCGYKSH